MNIIERMRSKLRHAEGVEVGRGASEEEIDLAERELSLGFPASYRQFLSEFGWAAFGPLEVFGLGPHVPRHLDVVSITRSERLEAGLSLAENLIPVANDGGGNLYCLDTGSQSDDARVILWNHEGLAKDCEVVADEFASWIVDRLDDHATSS